MADRPVVGSTAGRLPGTQNGESELAVGDFCVIAALPFTTPWMLLWGTAAVIPVLLHLWNKRQHETTEWAAMEFLLAALRKSARRRRFEQLLLLLVRAAVLLLFALALADPLLALIPGFVGTVRSGATHTVLVLDGSYSMGTVADDASRFARARQAAAMLVQQGQQGDGFTLVVMGEPPQVLVERPAFDPEDVLSALEQAEIRHAGADLIRTLDEVIRVVRTSRRDFPRLLQTRVCFYSDLARNSWSAIESRAGRERTDILAEMAELVLFDVGSDPVANVGVTNLRANKSLAQVGRMQRFLATIHNYGRHDREEMTVELWVNDRPVAEQRTRVAAGADANVGFQHIPQASGETRVEVRVDNDSLAIDNRRYLSLPVRETIHVLCVNGSQDAAHHLSLALNPNPTEDQQLVTTVIPDGALLELDLTPFEAVLLCNVARLLPDEVAVLERFVTAGGGVVFFLGNHVRGEGYHDVMGPRAEHPPFFPARIETVVAGEDLRLDPRDYRHPVVVPFRGFERAGLVTTPIWKYWRLAPYEPSACQVALWIDNDPVLLEHSFGAGHVLVVATAPTSAQLEREDSWSALAMWPSFPPLVHEILNQVTRGRDRQRNVTVGEPLVDLLEPGSPANGISVSGPNARAERVRSTAVEQARIWTFSDTQQCGFYVASAGDDDRESLFAVNIDPAESDPERLDPDLLPSNFSREQGLVDVQQPVTATPIGRPSMFRWILAAVLVLLIAESLLAARMDRGAL
ncbi:MAG: BatA domain-containing protein [Planctomycetales bacterium]|nr:BatA domain-containing protein [Planctomycetales bacterium]